MHGANDTRERQARMQSPDRSMGIDRHLRLRLISARFQPALLVNGSRQNGAHNSKSRLIPTKTNIASQPAANERGKHQPAASTSTGSCSRTTSLSRAVRTTSKNVHSGTVVAKLQRMRLRHEKRAGAQHLSSPQQNARDMERWELQTVRAVATEGREEQNTHKATCSSFTKHARRRTECSKAGAPLFVSPGIITRETSTSHARTVAPQQSHRWPAGTVQSVAAQHLREPLQQPRACSTTGIN